MAKTLYAVHMIRPIQALMMKFNRDVTESLPYNSGRNTILFENRVDALEYLDAAAMDPKYLAQMTFTTCGENLDQIAKMGRPGFLLQMACPESMLNGAQMELNKYTGVPAYIMPTTGMFLENVMVRLQADWLHYKGDFSMAELADEMHMRYEDFENLERTLDEKVSTRAMRQYLKPHDESSLSELRFVYGANGLINANFKTTDPMLDELRFMQQVMHKNNVGIIYMMKMREVEDVYKSIVAENVKNGLSPKEARASAVQEVARTLNMIAAYYKDTQAMTHTFDGFMQGTQHGMTQDAHEGHETTTPGEEDPCIFE